MIDYYLNKYCLLRTKGRVRCGGCIWNDKSIEPHKCVFALDYQSQVTLADFVRRISSVNEKQQSNLSNPKKRFVLEVVK